MVIKQQDCIVGWNRLSLQIVSIGHNTLRTHSSTILTCNWKFIVLAAFWSASTATAHSSSVQLSGILSAALEKCDSSNFLVSSQLLSPLLLSLLLLAHFLLPVLGFLHYYSASARHHPAPRAQHWAPSVLLAAEPVGCCDAGGRGSHCWLFLSVEGPSVSCPCTLNWWALICRKSIAINHF